MTAAHRIGVGATTRNDSWEIKSFLDAVARRGWEAHRFRPQAVAIVAEQGSPDVNLLHDGKDLGEVDALLLRSTSRARAAASVIVQALSHRGCLMVDGASRFLIDTTAKVETTVDRHRRGVGTTSHLLLGDASAEAWFAWLSARPWQPLIYKPVGGARGLGIEVWDSIEQARHRVADLFDEGQDTLLVQRLDKIVHEYRVLLLHGSVVDVARKQAAEGSVTANAAQGGTFVAVEPAEAARIGDYAAKVCADDALIGVDVAVLQDDELVVIEENYSPQWRALQEATGTSIADALADWIQGSLAGR